MNCCRKTMRMFTNRQRIAAAFLLLISLPAVASSQVRSGDVPEGAAARVVPVTAAGGDGKLDSFLGEPLLEMQPLFDEGRFPNVVVTPTGVVLASWGSSLVSVRRSLDGGQTWEQSRTVVEAGIQGGGMLADRQSGAVWLFAEEEHPPAELMVFRSLDRGTTWERQDVSIAADANGNVPSMHMNEHGIQLNKGKHAGRLIRASRWYAGKNDRTRWPQHYTNAIYSDDGGQSWQTSEPFSARGTGEAALVELSDGTIYYNSRRHWADEGQDPRRRWCALSSDGGQTWSEAAVCQELPDGPQDSDYGCMAGLVRLPVQGRDILLYSNCDSDQGRKQGTVWASFDGGQSWPVSREVFAESFAYSSMDAGQPGTPSAGKVFLFFEGGPAKGGCMAVFNLAWLLADQPQDKLPGWILEAMKNQ